MNKTFKSVVLGALALTASAGMALADSELFPGISTGIALGAPLPQGLYVVSIPTYGERRGGAADSNLYVDAPAWVIWSTPWTIAGGRLLLDTVTPFIHLNVKDGGPKVSGLGNTFLDAQLKWDLGGGFFGGFQTGVYLPSDSDVGRDWASFQGIGALSYLKDGWNLSATLIYGTGHDEAGVVVKPDWFNYDLTATKKIGKWELGLVGYGSTDLGDVAVKQSQFAAGVLVGYDFGQVNVQMKVTHDLMEENYGGKDTRVWANFIVPLWNPAPAGRDSLK